MLVRTTAHNSHAILVPGHHAAVMVKEIDVTGLRAPLQDALRSELGVDDLEKRTSRLMRKLTAPSKSASRSSPLLGHACSGSRQLDISKCGRSLEGTALSSPKLPDTLSRTRSQPRLERPGNWKNHSIIRYAMLPGQLNMFLFMGGVGTDFKFVYMFILLCTL